MRKDLIAVGKTSAGDVGLYVGYREGRWYLASGMPDAPTFEMPLDRFKLLRRPVFLNDIEILRELREKKLLGDV